MSKTMERILARWRKLNPIPEGYNASEWRRPTREDKPRSFVYLIEFDNGIKFGMSKGLKGTARVDSYKSPWCRQIKNEVIIHCLHPGRIERKLQAKFRRYIKTRSSEFLIGIDFDVVRDYLENVLLKQ